MVITSIAGGLGNQLFQFAIARTISLKTNQPLYLDHSWYQRHQNFQTTTKREFALHRFQLVKSARLIASPIHSKALRTFLTTVNSLGSQRYLQQLKEADSFKNALGHIEWDRKHFILNGYWQSFLNFEEFKEQIYEDLTLLQQNDFSEQDRQIIQYAQNSQSIALHIRRSDYVGTQLDHLTTDYYLKALSLIAKRQGHKLTVFVFSDDHKWASENLKFGFETIHVTHNGIDKPVNDLILMSSCNHNIIANSTFSWWAAWIGAVRDGIRNKPHREVIAPRYWWDGVDCNIIDIYPHTWTTL